MKNITSISRTVLLSCITGLVFFASCKKDDVLESRELLVYVQGDYGALNNMVTASLTRTPLSVWGNTKFTIPVHATREVPVDVNVNLQPDERLVSEFNRINNTKSVMLPANTYKFNSNQHTIKSGTFVAQSLEVEITNTAALTDTNGYVLPVTISNIETQDKGVRVSSNRSTAYLYVPYIYTNVDSTQIPITGTQMARTAWSVTVSNTTTGALGPAMHDGNNTTAWRSSNSATAEKWVVLNMGSTQTIKGFRLVPNYVVTAENTTQMSVFSSNDNVNWTFQGVWRGTGPATGTTATSPDIKGVNFITPVQARYFRFVITAWVSGSRVGIAELYAVQ